MGALGGPKRDGGVSISVPSLSFNTHIGLVYGHWARCQQQEWQISLIVEVERKEAGSKVEGTLLLCCRSEEMSQAAKEDEKATKN